MYKIYITDNERARPTFEVWGRFHHPSTFLSLSIMARLHAIKVIKENIARIANAVPVTLYSRVTVNLESVVLDCQKYNQCLKGHKSLGLFFQAVLHLSLSFSSSSYLSLSLSFCWSGHVSSSLWSNVSRVTSLWGHSGVVFSKGGSLTHSVSEWVSQWQGHLLSCRLDS